MASPPSLVKSLLAHHPGSAVPRASFLGCALLSWAALYCCCMGERGSTIVGVGVGAALAELQRWSLGRGACLCVWGGGGVHSRWCQRCCW